MASARRGRVWAYVGAGLGATASVAANVAHSFIPPAAAGAGAGWSPEPGAVVAAVFWPAALLVAIEILAGAQWLAGRRWVALRYLGLLPVAAVAAGVSYGHMSGLLASYGEPRLTVMFGPLAVDGLMAMATGALVAARSAEPAAAPARPRLGGEVSVPGSPPETADLSDLPEVSDLSDLPDLPGPAAASASPQAGPDLGADLGAGLAAELDRLGVPRDYGRDRARQALAAAGVPASTAAVAAAVRARKNGRPGPAAAGSAGGQGVSR
jgi:hypothetical protein